MTSQTVSRTNATISFKNADANKLQLGPLEDTKFNQSQKLSMVRYDNGNMCQIQTHLINLFTYGVPKTGPYYASDKARAFVKIPEDVNNPDSVLFFNKLEAFDVKLQSAEIKNKLFGKAVNQYSYQPIVRSPEVAEDDDAPEKKNKGPQPRYVKLKIDLDWESGKIKTKCFQKDAAGKRIPVSDINSVDEFSNLVRWKSSFVAVILMNKLYASKNKVGDTKKYGVTFKIVSLCAEQSLYVPNQSTDGDVFLEDDTTSNLLSNVKITTIEDDSVKVEVKPTNQFKQALDDDVEEDEDEDEDEGEDEGEDEVVEVVKPQPVVVQPPPKAVSTPQVKRRTKQ